jgi:TM2 domain-containing membrane protein YozV
MTHHDKRMIKELKHYGVKPTQEKEKYMTLTAFLALLPGGANFYLEQYGSGVLNFLTWPVSVVWAFPQTMIDANTINKQSTVDFYKFDKMGQQELQQFRDAENKAN